MTDTPLPLASPASGVAASAATAALPVTKTATLLSRLHVVVALSLLALAHVLLTGYQLGVGNQTIQIPFLRHAADPALFANDPMVQQTYGDYATWFFRLLAPLTHYISVPTLYFSLHLISAFGVLAAGYLLTLSAFRDRLAAVLTVVVLFAGHHRALAGDELFSLGFTHTFAILPLAMLAIALLYRRKVLLAFGLAGLLFNLHALTAAYLLAMFSLWAVFEIRNTGWKRTLASFLLFFLAAAPTLVLTFTHRQHFDADWIRVTWIRSADHSFPSTWWQAGDTTIPRFLLLIALASLALSWGPQHLKHIHRQTLCMTIALFGLFTLGLVFSGTPSPRIGVPTNPYAIGVEGGFQRMVANGFDFVLNKLHAQPAIIRLQLFRGSRLLLILALIYCAFGIASAVRPFLNTRRPSWQSSFEGISALFTLACIALPPLASYLPWALLLATLTALITARLSWWQAAVAAIALFITLLAWRHIHFSIPILDGLALSLEGFSSLNSALRGAIWVALLAGCAIWAASRLALHPVLRGAILVQGIALIALLWALAYRELAAAPLRSDPWIAAQLWAKVNTDASDRFLIPALRSGWRIHSERPVVAEWRDGTQAYFTASFAKEWWKSIESLQRGILYNQQGSRRVSAGKSIEQLADHDLSALAKAKQASYIVVPTPSKPRNLKRVYANPDWSIYRPEPRLPGGVVDEERWLDNEDFIENIALPNIERHRKSDARLTVVDASGNPISGSFSIRQTRSAFGFGASLPFFQSVTGESYEFIPPPVTQKEIKHFLEAGFNYSVIPFSGKWNFIEPVQGRRYYGELDKYVDFCTKHGVTMEFHYVGGFMPSWCQRLPAHQQQQAFINHALALAERYGDRIRKWQIINDARHASLAPAVIQAVRSKYPHLELGASDCTKFAPTRTGRTRGVDMFRGIDEVTSFRDEGAPLDFFSLHGHAPHGIWPDARDMYASFDRFSREGVRVNISEFMVPLMRMSGLRRGEWTPQLHAEFFERFYTIAFSHPAVDSVNYWNLGPDSNYDGAGLLDERFNPKPSYEMLKHLITQRWRTNLSGSLNRDGTVNFRGFHGEYEIQITLPNGKVAKGAFTVEKNSANNLRVTVNESNR